MISSHLLLFRQANQTLHSQLSLKWNNQTLFTPPISPLLLWLEEQQTDTPSCPMLFCQSGALLPNFPDFLPPFCKCFSFHIINLHGQHTHHTVHHQLSCAILHMSLLSCLPPISVLQSSGMLFRSFITPWIYCLELHDYLARYVIPSHSWCTSLRINWRRPSLPNATKEKSYSHPHSFPSQFTSCSLSSYFLR